MKESIGYFTLNVISTASSATETDPMMECEFHSFRSVSFIIFAVLSGAIFGLSALSLCFPTQLLPRQLLHRRNYPAARASLRTGLLGGATLCGFYVIKMAGAVRSDYHCSFSA
jgi:hypothetical protein